ncbi:MAG: ATP-binding cassette domain-containing protein [Clostridiales bacterium]|jgi:lincosamide and streptogramin A transport system ATP-binding/permease protein|nr:ATP-binding cassette domain-containing protein [Clostridiales bacterium]
MSLISIDHLTFAYEGSSENVFSDASFQIDTDWKLGFCGRNGRGKTTFLRLLMGDYEYSGAISASASFDYFPPQAGGAAQSTLDVLAGIAPNAELWQIQKELSKLSLGDDCLHRGFGTLSNGERTKALLAGLFLRENNFLLIDEPTNHLDLPSREIAARYLAGKRGFILVSHDRAFLDACVDHVLSINKAGIEVSAGNFSSWWEQKRRQDAFEAAQNERLAHEAERLKASAARAASWSDKVEKSKRQPLKSGLSPDRGYIGHKAAKMMKRSKSAEKRREDAIGEKEALLKNIERAVPLKISPLPYHSEKLLSLDKVSLYYGEKQVCRDVSFELCQGDRLALSGRNGCGKSSVLKLVCGESVERAEHMGTARAESDEGARHCTGIASAEHLGIAGGEGSEHPNAALGERAEYSGIACGECAEYPDAALGERAEHSGAARAERAEYSGIARVGSRLIISYVAQDASALSGSLRKYAESECIDEALLKATLRNLDFSRAQLEKDMGDYSAGQKKKVLLARSLCQKAHLYVWDEPLNYIDVYSRAQIEDLILAYRPTLLFIEHDRMFCDRVATKEFHFQPTGGQCALRLQ